MFRCTRRKIHFQYSIFFCKKQEKKYFFFMTFRYIFFLSRRKIFLLFNDRLMYIYRLVITNRSDEQNPTKTLFKGILKRGGA